MFERRASLYHASTPNLPIQADGRAFTFADHRIERRKEDGFPLAGAGTVASRLGDFTERSVGFERKEVPPYNAGIVLFQSDVSGRQVQGCEVSGERVDVTAVQASDEFVVM